MPRNGTPAWFRIRRRSELHCISGLHAPLQFGFSICAANHWLLYTSLQALKNADEEKYLDVYSRIDKEVIGDQRYAEDLWQKYDNPIPYFTGNILFDLFLKANDQPAGINSYNLAVELMVGEYRKNGLRFEKSEHQ